LRFVVLHFLRSWSALALVVPFVVVAGLVRAAAGGEVEAAKAVAPPGPSTEIVESRSTYQSQGKTIAVERFEPKAPGKYPAVVVLHGSGGMLVGGPAFRTLARELARRGYVAHVVHYFDLTGTFLADRPTMTARFPEWLLAVADGVTSLAKQPNVDASRIGVAGYSLGGYLAVALAMFDARVSAVVDYFGGIPDPLRNDIKSLPPTLILHGDADTIVPVAEAKTLEAVCRDRRIPHEVRIYAGQGHFFTGDDSRDAMTRALRFLDTHVKQAPTRHEVARPKFELLPPGAADAAAATTGQIGLERKAQ
jgi:carboxymethylenebutenolidase